jgi:hypothetical protein
MSRADVVNTLGVKRPSEALSGTFETLMMKKYQAPLRW